MEGKKIHGNIVTTKFNFRQQTFISEMFTMTLFLGFVVYSDKNEEKLKYVILLTVVIPGKWS